MENLELTSLRNLLSEAGLEKSSDALISLVRHGIFPTVTGEIETNPSIGASKWGGTADLAPDQPWPRYKDRPLNFLAQIALADLRQFEAAAFLPRDGLLSFFYGIDLEAWGYVAEDFGAWAVLWTPEIDRLEARPTPNDVERPDPYPCMRFDFEEAFSLPDNHSPSVEKLGFSEEDVESYHRVWSSLLPPQMFRLMGHPFTGQSTSESDPPLAMGERSPGNRVEEDFARASRLALEEGWRLLFALPYSEENGIVGGHSGLLHFFIRIGDLVARHFEQCWLIVEMW